MTITVIILDVPIFRVFTVGDVDAVQMSNQFIIALYDSRYITFRFISHPSASESDCDILWASKIKIYKCQMANWDLHVKGHEI